MTILGVLIWAVLEERARVDFESQVFPYSLVEGYRGNFLAPLITSLENLHQLDNKNKNPLILVVMPRSYGEVAQVRRAAIYKQRLEEEGYHMEPRTVQGLARAIGTNVIVPTPPYYAAQNLEVYIDFASTVAAFDSVIKYKKGSYFYAYQKEDDMVLAYTRTFEADVLEKFRGQTNLIRFSESPDDALKILRGEMQ